MNLYKSASLYLEVTLFLALSDDILDMITFLGELRDTEASIGIWLSGSDEIGNKASVRKFR
jgi:hypothetical protein